MASLLKTIFKHKGLKNSKLTFMNEIGTRTDFCGSGNHIPSSPGLNQQQECQPIMVNL